MMILLSWNCRELGNPRTVRSLHHLLRAKRPNLVFLIETKMLQSRADFIRIKLGFANFCGGL
jgi:hypothetical protein